MVKVQKRFRISSGFFALVVCVLFAILYGVLSVVRHNHYLSGFDLGINDQVVWEYSHFHTPITTIDLVPFISKLQVHIELIYAVISPFYWIWSDARMLIILQVLAVTLSGMAVYLLCDYYKLKSWIGMAMLLAYEMFYGVQFALWNDVHSITFGVAGMVWFIYFLSSQKYRWATLAFLMAMISKENIPGMLFLISLTHYLVYRRKADLIYAGAAILYLAAVFGIYFPRFVSGGYHFQKQGGLLSGLNPLLLVNTPEKLQVYLYSLLSFGFLPLLTPVFLIPVLGNLASYFILGSSVSGAQGLFMHYRSSLVPLLSWAAIEAIYHHKWLNTKYAVVILACGFLSAQYLLHLPLSYLTKSWFWQDSPASVNINEIIRSIPPAAAVVSQNNITPHLSQRDYIMTLWPTTKDFTGPSPCGTKSCAWLRWEGQPEFLIADTSEGWDIRHLLTDRTTYLRALRNMRQAGIIQLYKQKGNAVIYKISANTE